MGGWSARVARAESRHLVAQQQARAKANTMTWQWAESQIWEVLQHRKPLQQEGILEKFCVPMGKPQNETEEHAAIAQQQKAFENTRIAFTGLASGESSDAYLCLQPIFKMKRGGNVLWALEILARVKNGKDGAPMPFLAQWQVQDRAGALKFLEFQLDFAKDVASKFPGLVITMNVRPDEIAAAASKILEVTKIQKNVLIEVTEYSAINEDVISCIKVLKGQGVRFALDDVSKAVQAPAHGYEMEGKHACTFDLGKRHAELFEVQKLSLPLSSVMYRVPVYPTPEYDGGKPNPFFQKQIIDHTPGEPVAAAILERKAEIESWVSEVVSKRPDTTFIIECSLHEEELVGKDGLIPELALFDGQFCTQGGVFGGRGFTLDAWQHVQTIQEKESNEDVPTLLVDGSRVAIFGRVFNFTRAICFSFACGAEAAIAWLDVAAFFGRIINQVTSGNQMTSAFFTFRSMPVASRGC